MEERISSRKNPLLQQVKKLLSSRAERRKTGLFVADGTKLLEEAVKYWPGLQTVILTDGVEIQVPDHVRVVRVPEDVMASISPMEAPQGALFLGELPEQVTLGVRPEFITITPVSDVKASVYSTLPSGMETTVKLRLGDEIVTSVIFGSVDFPIDTEVCLAFHGTDMLLYSTETGKRLADGSL